MFQNILAILFILKLVKHSKFYAPEFQESSIYTKLPTLNRKELDKNKSTDKHTCKMISSFLYSFHSYDNTRQKITPSSKMSTTLHGITAEDKLAKVRIRSTFTSGMVTTFRSKSLTYVV